MKRSKTVREVIKLSIAIFINKPIGLLRDILRARYFGVGISSDAFSMAWRIPNVIRRIFGEGALASVLVPLLVKIKNDYDEKEVNAFITLFFCVLQLFVFFISCLIALYAKQILFLIAPGAPERIQYAIPLLRIMIFFSLFMSASNVLGNAVQVCNNFFIGPWSQFFLNIALCFEFFIALKYNLSSSFIAWGVLFNGFIILFMHIYQYKKMNFYFTVPTNNSFKILNKFIFKVIPALLSSMITDINIFIDQAVASYLPIGSQTIIDYVNAFVRVPLQIFGSSFATVSITHFSKMALRGRERVIYFLFESAKLMFLVAVISFILFYCFSHKGLTMIFLSDKFTLESINKTANLLILFSTILFFSMFNKIIHNVYYAYEVITIPTIFSIVSSGINTILNIVSLNRFGIEGIIISTVIAEISRTIMLLVYASYKFNIQLPLKKTLLFIKNSFFLIGVSFLIIYSVQFLFLCCVENIFKYNVYNFVYNSLFYFVWQGLIIAIVSYFMIKNKHRYNIKLYYLK